MITLTFTGLPSNPNQTKRNHWSANYQENQEWKQLVWYKAKSAYKGKPLERAKLHYQINVGDNRPHDADNIIASLKAVQDGLKGVAIIDDSIDNIEVSYSFSRQKPRGFTITISDIVTL